MSLHLLITNLKFWISSQASRAPATKLEEAKQMMPSCEALKK